MTHNTTIRSPGAIALGAFFAGVTGFVLFKDVLDGAAINTGHVLSLAALVAAIASGHHAWPAVRSGKLVPAIALVILFLAATGYVVIASGARNAETAGTKVATIQASNEARARESKKLARAEAMLAEAQRNLAKECATGAGKRCDGVKATVSVYEAAIKGHVQTLKELAPTINANGGYAHAAKVLASFPGVTADAKDIELRLSLQMPFITTIIAELGCITFLHLGLGHRPAPAAPAPVERPATKAPTPPTGRRTKRITRKADARADVLEFKRPVPQAELATRWGVETSMVSMWLTEWTAEGIVQRTVHGRTKMVQALPRAFSS